ncbi:MAG: general stress protein [Flavobacterium sp.]|uniref:pyridoxamine 5'-phosphate oxidase family protein n=1 Tax=Flavobacterium sp. TaxID=239 RepID=UPI00120AAA2F|nr:pyridoxamine 5'-phosphate oxidase family protein [Flavobacterium sp.]RZJ66390.1 MAG: general stress protein [Flavobacterium sp.]
MSEIKDLTQAEAATTLKKLAEDINICMFCTNIDQQPLSSRPMGLAKADDDGNLWFMSAKDSAKNQQIENDNRVQIFFAKPQDTEFLSVYGKATITTDRQIINDVWNPIANAWFKEGKEDPNVTVIKVDVSEAYYWDTKFGKFVSLVNIAIAAVTGTHRDTGIEGTLKP